MLRVAAAWALLALIAGCGSTGPGATAPVSGSPSGAGGAAAGASGSVGDLCASLSPSQLTEVGLAGSTSRSFSSPAPGCQWMKPGEFVPVVLTLTPGGELAAVAEAISVGGGTYRETEVGGLRALEGGDAEAAGAGVCAVLVEHGAGVLSVLAPDGCEQGRRILGAVARGLAS